MTLEFLNPNTYTFAGGVPVRQGKDLVIPDSIVLSQTMLIKWQIRQLVKGATIDQIPPATLSAVLEIPGMGTLDRSDAQIQASQQGKDVVQLWTIDPNLPYKITFSEVSDLVANSVLEFYQSSLSMGSFNNPLNVATDLSPVIAAISASSASEVTATQDLRAVVSRKVATETEFIYTPTVWSSNASNHIALAPDPSRFGGNFLNTGTKAIAVDKYLDIASKTSTSQHDGIIQPGGTYNFTVEEANMGYLLYALTTGGTMSIAVNVQK